MTDKHKLGQLKNETSAATTKTAAGNEASRAGDELKRLLTDAKAKITPERLRKADDAFGIIHLISGKTGKGEDFFAYISVKPSLYEEFCRKWTQGERMDVEKFGKVIKKGFGASPSDDVKQHMEEQFGIDHEFMRHFAEELERQLKAHPPKSK